MISLHWFSVLPDLVAQTERKEDSVSLGSPVSRCWSLARCEARMCYGWRVQKGTGTHPRTLSFHRAQSCTASAPPCLLHTPGHCSGGRRVGLPSSQPLLRSSLGVLSQLSPASFWPSSEQAQACHFPKRGQGAGGRQPRCHSSCSSFHQRQLDASPAPLIS